MAEAVAAEERKREEALDRLGREKGESKWVLSTAPVIGGGEDEGEGRFVTVGLGQIDAEDAGEEEGRGLGSRGRRTFGRVVKRKGDVEGEVGSEDSEEEGDSESESESEDEGPMDVDGLIHRGRSEAAGRARRELKEKRREEGRKSSRMASERRGRGMNLNSPRVGISSGGGSSGRGGGNQRGKRKSY